MDYKIISLPIAESVGDLSQMTYVRNIGQGYTRNNYIWYIDGPEKNIIVDTAGKAEALEKHNYPSKQINKPEEALEKVFLEPEDVDVVILTQAHFDHLQYAKKFPNAEFIIQEDELRTAKNPHPVFASIYEPIQPVLDEINFSVVEGNKEIVEGVSVMKSPGHTEGGQSVIVETEKGDAIITGLCVIDENFYPPEEVQQFLPVVPPAIHIDLKQAYDSMIEIKEKADIIVPLHEHKYTEIERIP